ncbi:MAG: hypothetical protein ABI199_08410 [Bacteroidia bacterium]
MKKIIFCGIFFLSYALKINAQTSKIIVDIRDTSEIHFLDSVETKLMNIVAEMSILNKNYKEKKQNKNAVYLPLYVDKYTSCFFDIPYTLYQVRENDFNKIRKFKTNQYQIEIQWDSTLTNAKILGFSRLYYYNENNYRYNTITTIKEPLFAVPLNDYDKFLSPSETKRLSSIIEDIFINYINDYDDDSLTEKNISIRSISFKNADSLTIMPLTYWVSQLSNFVSGGNVEAFTDADCKKEVTRDELGNICKDTLKTSQGANDILPETHLYSNLMIKEKWIFSIPKNDSNYVPAAITISKKINAIGINFNCYDSEGLLNSDNIFWIPYSEIKNSKALNTGKMALYQTFIDDDLFKKLNLKYPMQNFYIDEHN